MALLKFTLGTSLVSGLLDRASGTRLIRGCRVTMGGRRGPVDLSLTA